MQQRPCFEAAAAPAHLHRLPLALLAGLAVLPLAARAVEPGTKLDPVVVTGSRVEMPSFDLPLSVDAVAMPRVQQGNLGVNASEALAGVPGLVVQNRQNYAQDLQISIRGFGARAAFGVRGVKLIADGIPATAPDGQGQAATFNLDTASRIEVMRGPFSTIYGNHAGGVIQLFSRDGVGAPQLRASALGGSWGTHKFDLGVEGQTGGVSYVIDASRFETDGYRDHSAAVREQGFAKLGFAPDADSRLVLVASSLHQPDTDDPQGLSWATYQLDPRAVEAPALTFDTRKRIRHRQVGATYERQFGSARIELQAYTGVRGVTQFLSIPAAVQANPRHAGGVVDFDRDFSGLGARWIARHDTAAGHVSVTAGLDYDRSQDDRRGFENFVGSNLGVRGQLRRDEIDTVTSIDPYLQALWEHGPWQGSVGLRRSRVRFEVEDRFIAGVNGDDSGHVTYHRVTPAVALAYRFGRRLKLYASAGTGFETPTLTELSFSGGGGGFNFDLSPAISRQAELGVKAFVGDATRLNAALFHVSTRDELVVADSTGGRTSFTNAGHTRRRGIELAAESQLTRGIAARASLTALRAIYDDSFISRGITVPSGNHIPGIPALFAAAELEWQPRVGLTAAVEARRRSKVYVEDLNREPTAPAHTLVNLRLSAEQKVDGLTIGELLRVDNLFDRKHIASVIVGDTNGRFYEPGPARSWFLGVRASHRF